MWMHNQEVNRALCGKAALRGLLPRWPSGMDTIRKFLLALTATVFLMLAASGYCQDDWLTFRNNEFKFRFIYPPDWRLATPRGPNVRASVNSKPGQQSTNCNMVVRRMPDLAAYSQKQLNSDALRNPFSKQDWLDFLSEKAADVVVIDARPAKVDNRPAHFAILEQPYETVPLKIYLRSMTFVTLSPGLFWNFTCAAGGLTSEEARSNYQYWYPTLARIMSSVVFEQ